MSEEERLGAEGQQNTPGERCEGEWLDSARQGDRSAFDQLVLLHHDFLMRKACGLTLRNGDAEDLIQETWIRLWSRLKEFRGQSSFRTWLCGILIRVAHEYHKKQQVRPPELPLDDLSEDALSVPEDVSRKVAARELWQHLDSCLGPKRARMAILYYRNGMTLAEIADTAGVTPQVAEKRLRDIRKKLRTSKLFCRFLHEVCH